MLGVIGNRPLETSLTLVQKAVNYRSSGYAFIGVNEDMIVFSVFVTKSSGTSSCVGLKHCCIRNLLSRNDGVLWLKTWILMARCI